MKRLFLTLLLAATFSSQVGATLVVNGNINDWNINRNTWVSSLAGVHSAIEDTTGDRNTYLSPGYGGQAYDAEAMYALIQGDKLFVALVTGHNPNTKTANGDYSPGDFAFDFGKNGTYDLGINNVGTAFGALGGVYINPTWAFGLWDAKGNYIANNSSLADKAHPTSLLNGTQIGTADLAFSTVGVGGYGAYNSDKHFFYELSVDLSLLRQAGWDGSAFNIHWTENCANDSIMVDPGLSVPEPGSLALAALGMLGVLGSVSRRRNAEICT